MNAQGLDESLKPFYHGVASGDPIETQVIIWTRVTPESENAGTIEVEWKVATDPELTSIVNAGTVSTDANRDYTVKVDVTGLTPGATYYYGFSALGINSITGRTNTVPVGDVERLRFAVVSCNNYQDGFFAAFGKIADRTDLNAVIHLGDYIYEYSATGDDRFGNPALLEAGLRLHEPDSEIVTVNQYRTRYAQYRLDPNLRRAHQQHPFITIWDDHESTNNSYEDGAENHQPDTEGSWEVRKNVAKAVYSEWMPVRGDLTTQVLYRTFNYGNLMDLIMLDTRLEARDVADGAVGDSIVNVAQPGLYDENREILGDTQEQWLFDQLSNSTAKWKVIGNQIVFADFNIWWSDPADPVAGQDLFLDFWDGYPKAKKRVINYIDQNNIDNVVILTGDFHSSLASDVALEPAPLAGVNENIPATGIAPFPVTPTYNPETGEGSVAVEFTTPGISSQNFNEFFETTGLDPASAIATSRGFEFQLINPFGPEAGPIAGINPNPHIKFVDFVAPGYLVLDVTPERAQADWYFLDNVLDENSGESFAVGFGTNDGENRLTPGDEIAPSVDFSLQLLHASDLEGGVEAISNAPNFAAITDALEERVDNTVIISGGDNYIPGPFFNAAADRSIRDLLQDVYQDFFNEPGLSNLREDEGRVDISIMNIIGFDASAVGNHEFDAGPDAFSSIIGTDIRGAGLGDTRWLGAQFPYLGANLDFSNDGALAGLATSEILPNTAFQSLPGDLTAAGAAPKLAPATVIERNGEKIGVVGATTQMLANITSNGGVEVVGPTMDDMPALAAILQPVIDQLRNAMGINKIIVTSHLQQVALEKELATLLSGVDIIVAGGSDVLMAQEDDLLRPGDTADETYPFQTTNADGDPIVVLGTAGEYSYVGRLIVDFDANGVIIPASLDNVMNGAFATIDTVVNSVWQGADPFVANSKGELVQRLVNGVQDVVIAQDGNVFGLTDVFIEGRREQVRTEETNLGNLSADANLIAAQSFDSEVRVSLKNGGGIRAAIGEVDANGNLLPPQANPLSGKQEGEVSQLDIVNSLRFNNGLTILDLSYAQLKEALENGVRRASFSSTPGEFPQVGGISFSFDPGLNSFNRVKSITILDNNEEILKNGEFLADPETRIKIVTLDFIAAGNDGYTVFTEAASRTDLEDVLTEAGVATFAAPGSEQDALAEYFAANFASTPFNTADTPVEEDARIVNLSVVSDQSVLSFSLIDAQSNEPVAGFDPIAEGAVIDLAAFPTRRLNIRANTSPMMVGSVALSASNNRGESQSRLENAAPYALFGDNNGDYFNWMPTAPQAGDTVNVQASAFSQADAQGMIGGGANVNFSFIDSDAAPELLSLTLINADSDTELFELSEGAVIDLSALGNANLSIRANTNPAETGSVEFALSGGLSQNTVENLVP
ncbi:MAG: alkaline phosphatase D family protein, partial [Bacteroidota bacterium]